jgi:hypothetical protein
MYTCWVVAAEYFRQAKAFWIEGVILVNLIVCLFFFEINLAPSLLVLATVLGLTLTLTRPAAVKNLYRKLIGKPEALLSLALLLFLLLSLKADIYILLIVLGYALIAGYNLPVKPILYATLFLGCIFIAIYLYGATAATLSAAPYLYTLGLASLVLQFREYWFSKTTK